MLEAIEARAKEIEEKERECRLILEQGRKELEVKKNELSLIRDDTRLRQEKLSEQEKLIGALFERIEFEGKHIGDIRSSVDEGFRELCLKERQVADRWRELEWVEKQIESRENELDKKEEKLKSLEKEIELREKVLGSKQGMLEARESQLEAREKVLDYRRAKKRRKSGDKDAYENDSEQHPVIDLVGSDSGDSGHSGLGCDLNDSPSVSESDSGYSGSAHDLGKVRDPIVRIAWLQPVAHYPGAMSYRKNTKSVKLPAIKQGWKEWIDAGLPVGCGEFICGKQEALSLSRCNFLHQVCYKDNFASCNLGSPYLIHPQKGEMWALYKDCNLSCCASNPENHLSCQYEIVEIVQRNPFDTRVASLDKLEGYASLYHRRNHNKKDTFLIDDEELFRFSHKIPSFRLSSQESKGVPEGSFELDPKSLPAVS
ncbi:uncharacterized protein LOC113760130 [Coffea eugenioides]|uniref:uncharacterized protein LOC113760130 n=1 Tax=Coffea eugenioides TaxID=49369 RepID=UPI000F60B79F|nr:uncharacterized protein LOC113760130 [Coffea eugenioides]